ncbi:MAG: hypothetical protein LCI02_24985 [Proteobacteria bacterium]|nr:hypothetical protein [Pseudomonadota bacterium]
MHRAARSPMRRSLPLAGALLLLLAGCIVVPRSTQVYDPQCRAYVKQMVLEAEVIGIIGNCNNDGCAVMLASMGIVSAASAVVSGSVAVIGNIVYWAERQGRCPPPDPAAPAYLPPPAASAPLPRPPVVPGLVPSPST